MCHIFSPNAEPVIVQSPQNATALVGERHSFVCKVQGNPPPRVQWQYHGENLHRRGSNYRIMRTGMLSFDRLSPMDSGEYTCSARNSKGSTKSHPIYLNIEG